MDTTTINVNDVKKELYKTKVNAKFSHYTSGNLYYTVEVLGGVYQFPIATVEEYYSRLDETSGLYELSEDLGTTTFSSEIPGHSLNRWIAKAIEKNDFVKIG